jgi:hypothetical protein
MEVDHFHKSLSIPGPKYFLHFIFDLLESGKVGFAGVTYGSSSATLKFSPLPFVGSTAQTAYSPQSTSVVSRKLGWCTKSANPCP